MVYPLKILTVNAILMLKNTRSMVRSPDGDTPFFDITTGVLQGDILSLFILIICLDYICLDYILKKALDNNVFKSRKQDKQEKKPIRP